MAKNLKTKVFETKNKQTNFQGGRLYSRISYEHLNDKNYMKKIAFEAGFFIPEFGTSHCNSVKEFTPLSYFHNLPYNSKSWSDVTNGSVTFILDNIRYDFAKNNNGIFLSNDEIRTIYKSHLDLIEEYIKK